LLQEGKKQPIFSISKNSKSFKMIDMNDIINLDDIIVNSAVSALGIQKADGSFPPGHNGPWNNDDTPVRVTSHWGILLLEAFSLTKNSQFKEAAENAYSFLGSKKARPNDYSFHCINSNDLFLQSNGLIGQAWVLESLISAYIHFKDTFYLDLAEDLILKHNFDSDLCLWNVLGLNGEILKIHKTFNQQLWFSVNAYKLTKLRQNSQIETKTKKFFERIPTIISADKFINMLIDEKVFRDSLAIIKHTGKKITKLIKDKYMKKISRGYLSFSLFALADLYLIYENRELWNNNKLKSIIFNSVKFLDEKIYYDDNNKFGFQYNPIGFEVAFIKENFSDYLAEYKGKEVYEWIFKQLNKYFNFNKMMMMENTIDQNTLASRIYELTRLQDRVLAK